MRNSPTPAAPRRGRRRPRRRTRCCPRARPGSRRGSRRAGRPGAPGPGTAPTARRPCADTAPGSRRRGRGSTRPWSPSTIAVRQCRARSQHRPRPATAGISSAAATIAVWLARPPASVAKPRTRPGSRPAALAGRQVVRQDDRRRGQRVLERLGGRSPISWPRIRCLDVADVGGPGRQVRVGQPLRAGGVALEHLGTACSAAICSLLDPSWRASRCRVGSAIIRLWAARMSAYCGPSRVADLGLVGLGLVAAASRPRSSRSSSAATASAATARAAAAGRAGPAPRPDPWRSQG